MFTFFRHTFIIIWLGFAGNSLAQTKMIDSLQQQVYRAGNERQKLDAMIRLCDEYKSLERDTLDYYVFQARALAAKAGNQRQKDLAELAVAYDYIRWGWTDSVLVTVEPLIERNKVTDARARDIYFKASRLKALSYAMHSRYQEGLAELYKIVKEAETFGDTLTLGENINTIGSVALARNQPKDALTWLTRALAFSTMDPGYRSVKAAVYVNMADAWHQLGKTDSAGFYIEKGISLFKETQNLSNLALALQRQSVIFIAAHKLDSAESALKQMMAVRKMSGDSASYQDDNISLVDFYIQTNQVEKAIQLCQRALKSGDLHMENNGVSQTFTNNINLRLVYYEALARCYKITGDTKLYQQYLEDIIAAKDSFYSYNSAKAIAELETQYEVQKKENTIIQQKLDIVRKNNRFYTFLGIAFFIAILSWIMFSDYKKREKLKMALMLEKEKDLAVQSVAKAEENERKRIAADLHDNLGAYAASIVSNIDLITPRNGEQTSQTAIQELRNNSRAMVSQINDTIWALKKDSLSLTVISDRLKVFIQRIQASYPNVIINVVEKIDHDFVLSPSHAFHLFRIVQEAINNALRHSRAREITVEIQSNISGWEMKIADDGSGIKSGSIHGNGLINMKQRALESGWGIEWIAGDIKGTQVVISPTTN